MKKYTDVDIVAELQKLVDSHVDSYKEDFDIDKRIIRRAAESQNPEDKTLMWFCRPHGTHCLNENQVFIQGTRDHNTFRFYAEQTYDECIARVIVPKAVKRGKVFGDVFEINYREQAANVARNSVAPDHDRLTFADGYVLDAPCRSSFDAAMALVGEHGGVTLSGGEPLFHPGSLALLEALRAAGLHVAVETSGAVPRSRMVAAAPLADLWLYDIKDTDPPRLRAMTGADAGHILDNLAACDAHTAGRIRLRCILVRGVNHTPAHWQAVAALSRRLLHCDGVELLPYHAFAGSKSLRLGRPDISRPDWIPSPADIAEAKRLLRSAGASVLE